MNKAQKAVVADDYMRRWAELGHDPEEFVTKAQRDSGWLTVWFPGVTWQDLAAAHVRMMESGIPAKRKPATPAGLFGPKIDGPPKR